MTDWFFDGCVRNGYHSNIFGVKSTCIFNIISFIVNDFNGRSGGRVVVGFDVVFGRINFVFIFVVPWVVLFACSLLVLIVFFLCLSCNSLSRVVLFAYYYTLSRIVLFAYYYTLLLDELPHAVVVVVLM